MGSYRRPVDRAVGIAGRRPQAAASATEMAGRYVRPVVAETNGSVNDGPAAGAVVVVSVRSARTHDAGRESFECAVEHAVAGAYRAFTRVRQRSFPAARRSNPGEYETPRRGAKLVHLVGASVEGMPGSPGNTMPSRSVGIHLRLLAEDEGLQLIVFLSPRRQHIPAQSVVEYQVRTNLPAVLTECADIFVAQIKRAGVTLLVRRGDTQQVVGEIRTRLGPLKNERTVVDGIGVDVDLIEMKAAANLEVCLPKTCDRLSLQL